MNFRDELLQLLRQRALQRGEFILASGRQSSYYIDARQVTLSSRGAYLTAELLLERIQETGANAVGGLTLGADPIVGATLGIAGKRTLELQGFLVRKVVKEHGTKSAVEGSMLGSQHRVVLVDDTTTTGASYLTAAAAIAPTGCAILECVCVVDREEGARQALREQGLALHALFTAAEILG